MQGCRYQLALASTVVLVKLQATYAYVIFHQPDTGTWLAGSVSASANQMAQVEFLQIHGRESQKNHLHSPGITTIIMAELVKAVTRNLPSFKLGKKQLFLPSHVITFIRKRNLPPNEAHFSVPLRFTKFDLRDYLWNVYNVEVRKVRSYVQQQRIQRRHPYSQAHYRPQPKKFMNVELAKPFQWPEIPEDKEPWNHDLWTQRDEAMNKQALDQIAKQIGKDKMKTERPKSEDRKELASLANQILSGKVKWSNDLVLDPKWDGLVKEQATKTTTK
ncbi:ribosomal [Paramyrothecium foliicola]|nr:ribosomal [Paramyrothecium foliicola]